MRLIAGVFLILGLPPLASEAQAQSSGLFSEHWHTAGAGLTTPLGFNIGASYSMQVAGPFFVQASATASKDLYVTKHSVLAVGPAAGVRFYSDVAMTTLSAGPMYVRGARGYDMLDGGTAYEAASVNMTAQVLFRELNMGFELYTNVNPVRNVSGLRLIYRLGRLR